MIRLSELKLPLDAAFEVADNHTAPPLYPATLAPLIASTLGVPLKEIEHWHVFKRSFDARQKLLVVYIVDVQLLSKDQEHALLKKHAQHPHIQVTPDMQWHAPTHAPADWPPHGTARPVVVGFGPCGIFAA